MREELRAEAEEGCWEGEEKMFEEYIKEKLRRVFLWKKVKETDLWFSRRENGGRGGERHFLWLRAQLVSTLDCCGCQIFIPTLETAGGVNTVLASVIPPHKT